MTKKKGNFRIRSRHIGERLGIWQAALSPVTGQFICTCILFILLFSPYDSLILHHAKKVDTSADVGR